MCSLIRKRAPGSGLTQSHKKYKDEGLGSPLDGILSDKEGLIGDSQGEEDDHKWSGSDSDGVSPDTSDWDSD